MKTSARTAFVLSLIFSAVLFACLALPANVKQRPQKSSSARAKEAATKRARAKRPANPAPRVAAPEQARLSTPPPVVRRPELPERYDQPREAAEFFRLKRLPEGETELPVEKYFEAQEQMRLMPQFSTSANRFLMLEEFESLRLNKAGADASKLTAATWTPLGPGNIGGRTRAILINPQEPNIIYAAGVSGGVWKSTDAGGKWTPVADLISNLTVSSLAFEPGNPDVIYVGTGEGVLGTEFDTLSDFRGAGIFKTTDGGANWTRIASTITTDFYYVNKITISSNDKNRIYAATGTGMMRSLDGGVTWTKVLNPLGSQGKTVTAGCLDLAIRTDKTTDFVFASCGNLEQATVYRNSDAAGSGTWEAVLTATGMGRTALAIALSNQEIIYALASSVESNTFNSSLYAVFRSTSGGAAGSWNAQVRNTDSNKLNRAILSIVPIAIATDCGLATQDRYIGQGWYDLTIAVDPLDSNRVWVGGIEIFRSDDGGVNWGLAGPSYDFSGADFGISAIHPDQHTIVFHPKFDGAGNQTLYLGNDGGLFRTDNARGPLLTTLAAACKPSQVAIKWTTLNNNYGVTQFYHGVVLPDGKSYFGGTQDNGTLLGTDGTGQNAWTRINGGDGGYGAVDQLNPNILFASFPGFGFQKSTDGGNTFGSATFGLNDKGPLFVTPLAMDPSDSQRLWTGGHYLWRTTSGGARWERASAITAGALSVSAIAIAPTDANHVLIGMADGYIQRTDIALTAAATTSWPSVRLRSGYVSGLAFDPTNKDIAYATYSTFGGTHVWRSTDGGAVWTGIDGSGAGSLPDVPVHCIVIDPTNTARLYIGTDVGVFVSNDGGANWSVELTGFPNVITETLQLNVADGVTALYAFTFGRGVWRVTINNSGCNYALAPASVNVETKAGSGTINITAAPNGCGWTSVSNASWLKITGNGSGSGTARFEVEANTTFNSRAATATIAGRSLVISQPGQDDGNAPVVVITDPAIPLTVPNTTGLINLAGTATDDNVVTSITWASDRGAMGTAAYTASTARWTAANVPLAPGDNVITVTARDAAGNLARTAITLRARPPAVLITVAGTGVRGATGDGGPAAMAQITRAIRLDIDGAGNVYFTDSDSHTVRKITPAGVISTIAGRAGTLGSSGDGSPAPAALLNFPIGVAVDGSGNVYICDSSNHKIRKITAATGVISTIAGNGTAGFSGDGGPATAAQINTAQNVAVDKDGNVYLSDFNNNRIRKVNAADGIISTVAGTGQACAPAGGACGDGGAATAAQLNGPNNVSTDKEGNLIICDAGNFRIRKVTIADGKIATIVGMGVQGFSGDSGPALSATVNTPTGAIVDGVGNLYFSDRSNQRVRRVDAATNLITTIVGSGIAGFNGDGLPPLGSNLSFPTGLALDPVGNLYIGDRDNSRIRRLLFATANDVVSPTIALTQPTSENTFTTTDGALNLSGAAADNVAVFQVRWSNDRGGNGVAAGTTSWAVSNIPLQMGLNNLTLTAWDINGNAASARLAVTFNPLQIVTTVAGTGTAGDTGDGGPAVEARLFDPWSMALDAAGNLYIVDKGNHRIRKVSPVGTISAFAGNGMLGSSGDGGPATAATMNDPQSIAVDATGNVYIADTGNNRIRRIAPNGIITTVAGTGVGGFAGNGGPATQAQLDYPASVALDASGNLYIADANNACVRKVTVSTGVITTVAGDGRVGFGGDGGPATQAQFIFPSSVTLDQSGILYVADTGSSRIRRISPDGIITTFAGTGRDGYSGDGGPANAAQLNVPSFMTTDADGNLYLADWGNHRIRKITISNNLITTIAGNGTQGAGGDGTAPVNAQFTFPNDVALDRAGNIYIADQGNQRVRKILPASALRTVTNVSAASFLGGALASESIAAAFGANLAASTQVATVIPLPTQLAFTTVRVRDALGVERFAPLFFVAPAQVNLLIPPGTANGAATVTITGGDGKVSTGVVQIAAVAPGLFSANTSGTGLAAATVLRVKADGSQSHDPVTRFDSEQGKIVAVPIDLGPETDQVFLLVFGTGFHKPSALSAVSCKIGGTNAEVLYAGPQGDYVGLDQANVRLPRTLIGRGEVDVMLSVDGKTANVVKVSFK